VKRFNQRFPKKDRSVYAGKQFAGEETEEETEKE
jgi:hypothetical protein